MAQPSVGCQVECEPPGIRDPKSGIRGQGFGLIAEFDAGIRVACFDREGFTFLPREVQCLKKPQSNVHAKPSALVNRQRLKLVNSFGKRSTTFEKVNTVLDQRSRRLRSDSQKRAEPASSFRRHRPAPHGVRSKVRHRRAEPDAAALGRRRPNGRGRPRACSNAKVVAPRRSRRSRSRRAARLAVGNDEDVMRRRRMLQLA